MNGTLWPSVVRPFYYAAETGFWIDAWAVWQWADTPSSPRSSISALGRVEASRGEQGPNMVFALSGKLDQPIPTFPSEFRPLDLTIDYVAERMSTTVEDPATGNRVTLTASWPLGPNVFGEGSFAETGQEAPWWWVAVSLQEHLRLVSPISHQLLEFHPLKQ
jgi:hypothetical protein